MSTSLSHAEDLVGAPGFVYGHSPAIQNLNTTVREMAATDIPVLLFGESGTGKEVYGRLIHRLSKHCHTPLKKLSCRALEPGEFLAQLKSDLRGNGEGPEGRLGTLFLDGIDELDLACQKFLLSLLPDGEIDEGRFRRELYFRINGVCLRLPPLRDRREDIPTLLEHFLAKHAAESGREAPVLSAEEMGFFVSHDWPGNIRELENLAREVAVLGDARKAIDELRTRPKVETKLPEEQRSFSLKVAARAASRQAERELILRALERTHWNRKRAARELQISYKSLLYKIKQTGLEA